MRIRLPLLAALLLAAAARAGATPAIGGAGESSWEFRLESADEDSEGDDRQSELYDDGTGYLDEGQWDRAIRAFGEAARIAGPKADAALYWQAYAEHRAGRRADALKTIEALRRAHPKSRWVNDAKALEVEIRQGTGTAVAPESEDDVELKLIALNSLMASDPERAIPLVEKYLRGGQSRQMQEKALFVLAQSGSPRAREILTGIARGNANPDLQSKAIRYLGMSGARNQSLLSEVYAAAKDRETKEAVIEAWMMSGARDRLLEAARGEKDAQVREEAIQKLGALGAREELWQLYQKETSRGVKEAIIQGLFISGARQRVLDLARTEKDPELREEAIEKLGLMGGREELWKLYGTETSRDVKEAILQGLFLAGDRPRILELAKSEKDREMRGEAIQKLGVMGGGDELWQLYRTETDSGIKEDILQGLFISGKSDRLIEIIQTERDPDLKVEAIEKLGLTGYGKGTGYFASLYRGTSDPAVKEAVLQALFLQGDAQTLVAIAKAEKDRKLKAEAVQKLSLMRNAEAREYMKEILEK